MTTTKITFSGGFHHADAVNVRAEIVGRSAYLSSRQCRTLWRHFCGIQSCACGGANRADAAAENGWTVIGRPTANSDGGVVIAEIA